MDAVDFLESSKVLMALKPELLKESFDDWICDDLLATKTEVWEKMQELFEDILKLTGDERDGFKEKLWLCLNCVVFNGLNSVLMPILYQKFQHDDQYLFEKCKILAGMNVTAEQFGGSEDFAIHFTAAVVELASLDSHKSPLEKFRCLSATYDYIFAELKSVLIDVISKYSEKETDIPVINNCDIRPVLMVVLIKSKPVHFATNLYYIENFLWKNGDEAHIQHILSSFKTATEDLKGVTEKTMRPGSGEVCRSLDLRGVIEITSPKADETVSVLKEQRGRIGDLIIAATNERNVCK